MRIRTVSPIAIPAVLTLLSCTDPSSPTSARSITVAEEIAPQSAVGSVVPVVVEVHNTEGRPLGGTTVRWRVMRGGGSISPSSARTDRDGRATALWTLGTFIGENRLLASVDNVEARTITVATVPDVPASISIVHGNQQVGLATLELGEPLAVRVRDAYGNDIPDANVTFTPSDGTVSPPTVSTDLFGIALTTWTAGTQSGEQTVDAVVGGLPAARFTAAISTLDEIDELDNDAQVGGLEGLTGEMMHFRIVVPDGTMRLTVRLTGFDGDADLYVRHGTLASRTTYACRSILPTSTESCTIEDPEPGNWFIMLHAFRTFSDASLRATHAIGGNLDLAVTGLPQGANAAVAITGVDHYDRTVSESLRIDRLMPGDYTVTGQHVLVDDIAYNASPLSQQVTVVGGSTSSVTVEYAIATGLNFDISRAYITQGVQRPAGDVALVAGRPGLLRVFARGNAPNTDRPTVRARIFHDGILVDTRIIDAPGAGVPVTHDEGNLGSSWNTMLDGSLIRPGMHLLIDVDPDNAFDESNEADNAWPAQGALVPVVRTASVMSARLVPVRQSNGLVGDVRTSNIDSYITNAYALYPLPQMDVDVRAPYSFTGVLGAFYDSQWSRLLSEIGLLRVQDGSDRYYYGVISPAYSSGGTGLGYLALPAAIGVDWTNWRAETVAHEWGHNFGRLHVACGGAGGPDPLYPHTDWPGALGYHGYDMRTNTIRSKETHFDLMSYCLPSWASDYTYEAVMNYRAAEAGIIQESAQPVLLVWGRISGDSVILEPAFETVARPVLPSRPGKYTITGRAADGGIAFDLSFDGYEIDHMPGVVHFAYAVPIRSMRAPPASLELAGAARGFARQHARDGVADVQVTRAGAGRVRITWDAARSPVLMVRDRRSGEVLSLARDGEAYIETDAAELDISTSNGVRSRSQHVVIPR